MPDLASLKTTIRDEASTSPETFFPVREIRDRGFSRGECARCGTVFWSLDGSRDVCGEPDCSGGYGFINDPPTDKEFTPVSAWDEFSSFMEERDYEPIDRYPLAARWRNDTDVVRASIYDFQPYVVTGEVKPPANPLVVPQFCFRSNDIDNVGITGRHYTGFIMVGQHAFTAPDRYEQDKYFRDMLDWIVDGMGIPIEEVVLHEDAWGGGGNLGASIEFFVGGLELFNQVYMSYRVDEGSGKGYTELDTKVLDMGMGLERIVWITQGSETSYEANMPHVVEQLYERTGVEPDRELWSEFLPYSGHLNLDEVDDIDKTWEHIASEIGVEVEELKDEVLPAAALYAIADHTRTLLVALNDGLLPSNRGERHSLRIMLRRCLDFIQTYGWDLGLVQVIEWQIDELAQLFPELRDSREDILDIIRYEEEKYNERREEAERFIEQLEDVDEERLIEIYDSKGITPEMLQRNGIDVDIPSNFYQMVSERHGETESHDEEGQRFDIGGLSETERLYYRNEYLQEFEAEVVEVIDNWVVLDRTAFYPTSGGQEHDTGVIGTIPVTDVRDEDGVILHQLALAEDDELPEPGETVGCEVDWARRKRLMHHHTATHIVNGAARAVLGDHVWQDGAHKTEEKGRLDITHYQKLDRDALDEIEERANQVVDEDMAVEKTFMDRSKAEERHGFRLYQGGAVPGNDIRVVDIGGWEAEACGGTHVESTGELDRIIITGSSKVQDGTIRLEYVAGDAAEEYREAREQVEEQVSAYVDTDRGLLQIADIFSVEVEHLPRVVERFVEEWNERKEEVESLTGEEDAIDYQDRPRDPERLFQEWKEMEKDIERLREKMEERLKEELAAEDGYLEQEIETEDVGMLIRVARHLVSDDREKAVLLKGENAAVAASGVESDIDAREAVSEVAENVEGDAEFAKGFKLR